MFQFTLKIPKMKNFILVLAVLFLFPAMALKAGDDPVLEMDRTFQSSQGLTLYYDGISGDISVKTWSKDEVNIKVFANTNAKENMEIQLVDGSGGININESSKYSSARGKDIRLKYEITLPSSYNITVNTSSSDMEVSNLSGNIYVQSSSGDCALNNISGDVTISTASGDIATNNVTGNIHISTASGDLVHSMTDGKVTLSTASGDITVKDATESVSISTTSGDVVYVCTEHNAGATINTLSGDIILEISDKVPATVFVSDARNVRNVSDDGKLYDSFERDYNGGGSKIYCTTKSGDVTINDDY